MFKPILSKLYILAIAICCTGVLVTSCSEDDEYIPVAEVSLSNPELLLLEGQKQTLQAILAPEEATERNVTWQSSDESVAAVSETGEVEAKSIGTATITVTTVDGNKTATCEVTVQKTVTSVTGISLNKTELPMLVGAKETLTATVAPENATIKTVIWTSDNEAVATVGETGEVVAVSIGTATITATTVEGGKKATCSVTVDASRFVVKFVTNGGSQMDDVVVAKGEALVQPANPTMPNGPGEGLYLGNVDPEEGSIAFGGWFTDEQLTNAYDFGTVLTNDLTLYAKWTGDVPQPIDVSASTGNNIVEKGYAYLKGLTLSEPTEYTLILAGDVTANANLGDFRNANVIVTIVGKGEERVIQKTNSGNLFVMYSGTMILGNRIKITGTGIGAYYLFYLMETANLVMKEGSKISDVTGVTANAGAVHLNSGNATFTMEGGEICNNVVQRAAANIAGAAVCVSWGKFYMKGGLISGNKVVTSFNTHHIAGGVYVNNWNQFHKTGGIIKDNTAEITAAEAGVAKMGQQVFYSANNNDPSSWKKVDDNLGETDNLTTDNVSDPLWKAVD